MNMATILESGMNNLWLFMQLKLKAGLLAGPKALSFNLETLNQLHLFAGIVAWRSREIKMVQILNLLNSSTQSLQARFESIQQLGLANLEWEQIFGLID